MNPLLYDVVYNPICNMGIRGVLDKPINKPPV